MAQDVLLVLAEQMKLPLTQIAHAAELLEIELPDSADLKTITLASRTALHFIDSYLLSLQIQREGQLELESVSISSLLYDTAESLQPAAKASGCEIELVVAGRYLPVISNRRALKAALTSMGHSFIEAVSTASKPQQRKIKLAVKRTSAGISTGVFADSPALTADLLKRAHILKGNSHQPMAGFVSDSAAGVFVADQLLSSLEAPMKVARLNGLNGLAATLKPSNQLSLV